MQTVLIIDDDKFSHKFITRALKDKFNLIDAYNGEEGIEKVGATQPDVILLDVEMPGLNGYEVCDQLKCNESTANIPVVFLSAHGSLTQRMQGYEAGADDYLVKPFVPEDLTAKIQVLANYRTQRDSLNEQVKEAREIAHTAITGTSDLGRAMQFIENSYSISSYEELAKAFFTITDCFNLKCIIYIEANDDDLYFSSTQEVTPLESELIFLLRQEKRFYDFGCRTQINYPQISVLIKNMPLDNASRYGQIKDLLPAILSAADTKINRLNTECAIQAQTEEIKSSFDSIKNTLTEISLLMQKNQASGAKVMHDMLMDLDRNIPRMGLDDDQEEYILTTVDSSIQKTMDTFDAGKEFANSFEEVSANLQNLIEKQNQLVDQIISKPEEELSESEREKESYSMDIELF